MTTVVFKDGVMAADRQGTYNGVIHPSNIYKLLELNGCTYGFSGCLMNINKAKRWLEEGRPSMDKLGLDKESFCYLKYDNKLYLGWIYDDCYVHEEPIDKGFYAIGSGSEFAIGAMEAGADAEKAVEIACNHDIYSGGGVDAVVCEGVS